MHGVALTILQDSLQRRTAVAMSDKKVVKFDNDGDTHWNRYEGFGMSEVFRIGVFKKYYDVKRREELMERIKKKLDNDFDEEEEEEEMVRCTERQLLDLGEDGAKEFKRRFS